MRVLLMDAKDAAVALGAIILAACLCYYFYYYPAGRDYFFGRADVSYASANAQLQSAGSVCIVENISGMVDPERMNIMNCGIDFAASLGGIKGVDAYALEGDNCTSMTGLRTTGGCAMEIHAKGCYIIFIGPNETGPRTLDGLTYVPISESYQNMSCFIRAG
jgi:hypothetical protein